MKRILAYVMVILFVVCLLQLLIGCQSVPQQASAPSAQPVKSDWHFAVMPWGHQDWSDILGSSLVARFSDFEKAQADMPRFCPNYLKLSPEQRQAVWGYLAVSISKFESSWKLSDQMTESDGAVSQGLFQLTYGDNHCPKSYAEANLNDPAVNIKCAVSIMADWAASDAVVAAGGYVKYGSPPPKGLAHYWSVLRIPDTKSSHHLKEIQALTAQAPGCK